MNNPENLPGQLVPVPSTMARTIDGFVFDPGTDFWIVPTAAGSASFNFRNLPGASEKLCHGIKAACASMLLAIAPERAMKALSGFRVLIRFLTAHAPGQPIDEISMADVYRYGASLPKRRQYQLRRLKEYLLLWVGSGAPGLTMDLRQKLPKLLTETHEVGAAVRTMDPEEGPLTDIEYESVIAAIRHGFATGTFSLSDYALLVLAIALGARPLQLAMMKVKDFSDTQREDGSSVFILQVTRLKQGKGIRPRTLFRPRELASGVGELLRQQCAIARLWAEEHGIAPEEAPIFPSHDATISQEGLGELGLEGHISGKGLSEKLSRLFHKLSVQSARTGKNLNLFQTRLRRTFGTRAAAEGLSAAVIADLMDHS